MKRRGMGSPDIADALATTFAAEMATLPVQPEWVGTGRLLSEYDPFAPEWINRTGDAGALRNAND
jgi:hypothetical protein